MAWYNHSGICNDPMRPVSTFGELFNMVECLPTEADIERTYKMAKEEEEEAQDGLFGSMFGEPEPFK